jgi:hypothetical protein
LLCCKHDSQTAPAPVEITPQPNETNELADDSASKEITPAVTSPDDVKPANSGARQTR